MNVWMLLLSLLGFGQPANPTADDVAVCPTCETPASYSPTVSKPYLNISNGF